MFVSVNSTYGTLSCHLLVKSEKKQEVGVAIFICVSHETMYRGRVCRGGIWSDGSVTFLIVFLRQYNGVSLWNVKNVILK